MPTATRKTILWSARTAPGGWTIQAAATRDGLCYVSLRDEPLDVALQDRELVRDDEALEPYLAQLEQYLCGKRAEFDLPLDVRGTPFQEAVWERLRAIPYGETRTYSDIAREIGNPSAVRGVGAAVGANPALLVVPCHRVIGKNGKLAGFRDGLAVKERLLRLENEGRKQTG